MFRNISSFLHLLGLQIFESLIFNRTLEILVTFLHTFSSLNSFKLDHLNSLAIVYLLLEIFRAIEVSEVHPNHVEESKDGREQKANPPEHIRDFWISVVLWP